MLFYCALFTLLLRQSKTCQLDIIETEPQARKEHIFVVVIRQLEVPEARVREGVALSTSSSSSHDGDQNVRTMMPFPRSSSGCFGGQRGLRSDKDKQTADFVRREDVTKYRDEIVLPLVKEDRK